MAIPVFKARFCPSQTTDFNSVNGTMFSSLSAFQRCKVRPNVMDIHGVHLCYETGLDTGTFRLDARFLHSWMSYSNSVNGTTFSSFAAFQRCNVHPNAMDIHGVRFCYETGIYTGAFRLGARFLRSWRSYSN